MRRFLAKTAMQRASGGRPSKPRTLLAASVAGAAAWVLTYRVLRSG
jgi:hypothetical protein